ncbi:type II toxin-antitoxin system VapB family antitoxin [Gordonia sp. Z-3]|uniref:type II toxin-antitoxin system VapB family antitoxin n=1 Tax=unclassified Gordonia (in: high G+C Gram-positive bacteria) TaxID=2657482 RepID=UPI000C57D8C7|nr:MULTISPECIES: type II toxin-antitoxin system VapB family antitoxin [unclassified Gordonia (in: high G+C Gram-positive bacteria)]MAQ82330.1 antitoxin VapB [Maritimibacter sp.]MAU84253.1 antitoxin VapB [Gordonia sp. (in: high G+C Gram-positive bacteria)]MED5800930.1 type II toxin-antitoxin system VapB family antitoxin [Gordonia sp. Z-3]
MIFKGVRDGRPYPDHGMSASAWAKIPPRQFRLDELTTVTTVLALDRLLSEDSTFYGDLFSHVVRWRGDLYLEDGLHRAVRSALRNRHIIHARMLDLDAIDLDTDADSVADRLDTKRLPSPGRAPVPGGAHRKATRSTGWTLPSTTPPQW